MTVDGCLGVCELADAPALGWLGAPLLATFPGVGPIGA